MLIIKWSAVIGVKNFFSPKNIFFFVKNQVPAKLSVCKNTSFWFFPTDTISIRTPPPTPDGKVWYPIRIFSPIRLFFAKKKKHSKKKFFPPKNNSKSCDKEKNLYEKKPLFMGELYLTSFDFQSLWIFVVWIFKLYRQNEKDKANIDSFEDVVRHEN